jgi:uncharacterized LabA/DUF88 family protein
MSTEPTEAEKKRMEEHEEFMKEILSQERWAVRLGKLQRRWDGHREYFEQKRVDVLLSVDMVRHSAAGHIQHVIVVAGDSDFIPAIDATKDSGATVTLWYFDENSIHKDLLEMADTRHQIDLKKMPKKKIKKTQETKNNPQPQKKRPPQAKSRPKSNTKNQTNKRKFFSHKPKS